MLTYQVISKSGGAAIVQTFQDGKSLEAIALASYLTADQIAACLEAIYFDANKKEKARVSNVTKIAEFTKGEILVLSKPVDSAVDNRDGAMVDSAGKPEPEPGKPVAEPEPGKSSLDGIAASEFKDN